MSTRSVRRRSSPASTTPLSAALLATKRHFVWAAGFSALLNLLYLAPTLYMLQVYDRVVPTRGQLTLLFLTLMLILSLLTLALLDHVRARLLVRGAIRLDRQLAGAILDATLGGTVSSQANLTKQAMRQFDILRQAMGGAGMLALFDAPWAPIYILACFLIHPWLGTLALIGAVLLLLVAWRNERATRDVQGKVSEAANIAYVSQDDSIANAGVLRALGMRKAMVQRHLRERQATTALQAQASLAASGYSALTRFVRLGLQSTALGLGALLAIDDKISAGAIFASSFLVARALSPVEQIIGAWNTALQARTAYGALQSLFEPGRPDVSVTQLPPPEGRLAVERLVVLNETRDGAILRDVTFQVPAGEIVGIIGPSGAGKSTLMRMIAGAATPDQGAVRFDGAETRDWDPERLARHIGYVPQEPMLFAGTVKENIARFRSYLGEPIETIDALAVAAAQLCGAHEMILRLPNGYDTQLGWGGRGLSSGQAQRIALARALFDDPSLVILDEPNAHLDAEGELHLIRTLQDLKARRRTVLIVAHRTSVLQAIDRLLVLRDGRVDHYGGRDEVLRKLAVANPAVEATTPKPLPDATPEGVQP